jgi:hypothetical protein
MKRQVPMALPPLTEKQILLLQANPDQFLTSHPERVMLQTKKDKDGNYVFTEIAVIVR